MGGGRIPQKVAANRSPLRISKHSLIFVVVRCCSKKVVVEDLVPKHLDRYETNLAWFRLRTR
jgi:hypothetical protein